MNHKIAGRKFGRTANQRKSLLKGLVSSLFEYQKIETTLSKAKSIISIAEKLITFGKRGDLHSKRMVMSYISNRVVTSKLFSDIAPRFSNRNGGYLRITKTRQRVKDAVQMAVIEFIDYNDIKDTIKKTSLSKTLIDNKSNKDKAQATDKEKNISKT